MYETGPLRVFHPIFYCKHGSGYSTVPSHAHCERSYHPWIGGLFTQLARGNRVSHSSIVRGVVDTRIHIGWPFFPTRPPSSPSYAYSI